MSDLDSEIKRRSAFNVALPFRGSFPTSVGNTTLAATVLAPFSDQFGVWSVKRIAGESQASMPLVRIRRGSDSVEQDFSADIGSFISKTSIDSFLGGATGYVAAIYDQCGTAGALTQSSAWLQPLISTTGTHATIKFDRTLGHRYSGTSNHRRFCQRENAASMVAVRKYYDLIGAGTTVNQSLINCASNTDTNTNNFTIRMSTADTFQAISRRLSSEAISTASAASGTTAWGIEIAVADWGNSDLYHRVGSASTINGSLGTTGRTTVELPTAFTVGNSGEFDEPFGGEISAIICFKDFLTTAESAQLVTLLDDLKN